MGYMIDRGNPVNDIYRSLERELDNPDSKASKMLTNLHFEIADEEILKQLIIRFEILAERQEQKRWEVQREKEVLHKEEKEKQSEQRTTYNEAVREEGEQAAKLISERTADELHREMMVHVENIKKLDDNLYHYEEDKKDIDKKIEAIDKEIAPLEKEWKVMQEEIAKAFIDDNFALNEHGKYVTAKSPAIELMDNAVNVLKEIFTSGKSPAELQVHNPTLIDHPERVSVQENVRKEINIAKKIDKIVDKKVKEEINKARKIMVKEVVLDDDGNPVFEVDANGKKKAKTILVERDPVSRDAIKASDRAQTDESRITYAADESAPDAARKTKREGAKLVCLGDVCFMVDHLMAKPMHESAKPIIDNDQHKELTQALLQKGEEKRPLVNQRDNLIDRIDQTKAEIESEKQAVDHAYLQLADMHQAPHIASPLEIRPTPDVAKRIEGAAKEVAGAVKKMLDEPTENAEDEKPRGPRPG